MRKKLSLILVTMFILTSAVGCADKDAQASEAPAEQTQTEQTQKEAAQDQTTKAENLKLKDGTYHAEGSADEKGWTPTADVVIENNKITAITFDDVDASGMFKSKAVADGNYDMTVNGAKASWTDEIALFAAAIVDGSIDVNNVNLDTEGKTDAVSGCTISVSPYVELVKSALEQAKIQS
ncbi:MAG: FMN-binding protein [Proteocatella sp.]